MINKESKLLNKASHYYKKERFQQAIEQCQKAIKLFPNSSMPYKLRASNEIKLHRYLLAESNLIKAIDKGDSELSTKHLLAIVFQKQNKFNEAINLLENLFNKTGEVSLLLDLAHTLSCLGKYQDSIDIYKKSIELEHNNFKAMFNLSRLLIEQGDFKLGWSYYNARHLINDKNITKVNWLAPHGLDLNLTDKHVLIWPEQGIGDMVIFISCFAQIIKKIKKVSVLCENRFKELLIYNFPEANIYTLDTLDNLPPIDYQLLAGDLPSLCWKSKNDIPKTPILNIDNNENNKILEILHLTSAKSRLKIGLSWFHGKKNDGNLYSFYLEELLPILNIPNIDFYSLQYGDTTSEIKSINTKYNIKIHEVRGYSAHDNFMKYSALIKNMDLVISASNAAAEFSGILGKVTYVTIHGRGNNEKIKSSPSPFFNSVYHIKRTPDEKWNQVIDYIKKEVIIAMKTKLN